MEFLNNREIALLVYAVVGITIIGVVKNLRVGARNVLVSFLNPQILIPLIIMLLYVWLEVWLALLINIWSVALLKETIMWVITSGILLFFKSSEASSDPKFYSKRIIAAFGITVFIEVFVNLYSFNLIIELILLPVLAALGGLSVVAAMDKKHLGAKKLVDGILLIIGFLMLLSTLFRVMNDWSNISTAELLMQFALPVWLSIGILPFIYVLSLYANYQITFMRLRIFCRGRRSIIKAALALLIGLNVRPRLVHGFTGKWLIDIGGARTFRKALKVVRSFRKHQVQSNSLIKPSASTSHNQ